MNTSTPRKWKWSSRVKVKDRSSGLAWHYANKKAAKERAQIWDLKNPGKRAAQNKAWYKAHPNYKKTWREKTKKADPKRWKDWNRDVKLRAAYGISLAKFNEMLKAQGGGCAVCRGPANGMGTFHVDHDHTTGVIRGLLCHSCNCALGLMKEDPKLLRKLIRYIGGNY
jgi:hypothetical protein